MVNEANKESYIPIVLQVSHGEVFVCIGSRIPWNLPELPREKGEGSHHLVCTYWTYKATIADVYTVAEYKAPSREIQKSINPDGNANTEMMYSQYCLSVTVPGSVRLVSA